MKALHINLTNLPNTMCVFDTMKNSPCLMTLFLKGVEEVFLTVEKKHVIIMHQFKSVFSINLLLGLLI